MTLPNSIFDREYLRFEEVHGKVHARVKPDDGGGFFDEFKWTTPLANGEEFVSPIVDTAEFLFVRTEIFSDKTGVFTGEWVSEDGSETYRTFTLNYTQVNEIDFAAAPNFSRYLRLRFLNNSGEDQTNILLQTKLSNVSLGGQTLRIDRDLPGNIVAQTVRSIIAGLNETGTYSNVTVNDVGAINVSSFFVDVSRGRFPSYKANLKFGRNPQSNTNSTPEDIWDGGGIYTGQPISAVETIQVFSSSANDTSAGTGARTIQLEGLDADWNEQVEVVTLNGTTPVTTVYTWRRMSRAYILTAGTLGYNEGTITARHSTTTTNVFAVMPPQANQTSIGASTVPAGKIRVITNLYSAMAITGGTSGSANHAFLIRAQGGVFRRIRNIEVASGLPYNPEMSLGIVLPEKTDMRWRVSSVSNNGTISTAEFEFIDIEV